MMNGQINPESIHACLISTGKEQRILAEGIGCNFILTDRARLPRPEDKKRWNQILHALDDLKMGWMRVGLIPTKTARGIWDEKRCRFNFRHKYFKMLVTLGKWANKSKVNLMYDPFGVGIGLRDPANALAKDPYEYAEKQILPVARFIRENGLHSYKYFGLINEHIWGPNKGGYSRVPPFFELFKAVREILDREGFEHIGLIGPSALNLWEWPITDFMAARLDLPAKLAAFDQHYYLYYMDWMPNTNPEFLRMSEVVRNIQRWSDFSHKQDKPFFVTELGNFYCGRLLWGERDWDGPRSHTGLMMDAELIVRGLNAGADGFLRWVFSVVPDFDGDWSFMDPDPETGDFKPSPVYTLYRMFMRAVQPRATVMETKATTSHYSIQTVYAAAVKNPDGNSCLLIVNDFPGRNIDSALMLDKPFKGKKLFRLVWDETRKGVFRDPVVISSKGEGKVTLTGSSLTILSTKKI